MMPHHWRPLAQETCLRKTGTKVLSPICRQGHCVIPYKMPTQHQRNTFTRSRNFLLININILSVRTRCLSKQFLGSFKPTAIGCVDIDNDKVIHDSCSGLSSSVYHLCICNEFPLIYTLYSVYKIRWFMGTTYYYMYIQYYTLVEAIIC